MMRKNAKLEAYIVRTGYSKAEATYTFVPVANVLQQKHPLGHKPLATHIQLQTRLGCIKHYKNVIEMLITPKT